MSPWTQFHDMHSGGGCKEPPYGHIFIEAPESEARAVFYARFGHSPDRVSCTCCGEDYSVTESDTLEQATSFERGCDYAWFVRDTDFEIEDPGPASWDRERQARVVDGQEIVGRYVERPATRWGARDCVPLDAYRERADVLFITADEITTDERTTNVPMEGYVWQ